MEQELDFELLEKWLEDLDILILKMNGWMLLQRSSFDLLLEGEPHHSIQLLINTCQRMYIIRVWSRTVEKGKFRSIDALKLITTKTFLDSAVCTGYFGSTAPNNTSINHMVYPFPRWMSPSCAFIFQSDSDKAAKVGVCSACSGTNFSIVDDLEPNDVEDNSDPPSDDKGALEDFSETSIIIEGEISDNHVDTVMDEDGVVCDELDTADGGNVKEEDWMWPDDSRAPAAVVTPKIRKTKNVPTKSQRTAPTPKPWLKSKHCLFCPAYCKTSSKMQFHLTYHHALNTYNCHLCTESRCYPKDIASHILEKHPGTETANCPVCKGPVHFGCDPQDFEDHYRQCKKSNRNAIVRKTRMTDKMKGKGPPKTNFECHICGRVLRGNWSFKYHLARHQKSELPFKCDHVGCDMAFPVQWELKL